ncbi:MAG: fibronectin type III domain-containing protein [Chloroflexota bacterium]
MSRRLASRAVAAIAALTLLATGGIIAGGPVVAADQVIARDSFGRTTTGTLGRGYRISGKARWSVADATGVSRLAKPGVGQATLRSGRSVTADVRVIARISNPTQSRGLAVMAVARRVAARYQYEAQLVVDSGGNLSVRLVRRTGSHARTLIRASTGYQLAAAGRVHLRLRVTGTSPTTLSVKAWPVGAAEPGWQAQVRDGTKRLQRAGNVGIGVIAPKTVDRFPVVVRFDDLRVVNPAKTQRVTANRPAAITGLSVTDVGATQATVRWSLDQRATGVVDYGTTRAYDLHSVKETSFRYSQHVQQLTGLQPGTTYHFRVRSVNQAGAQSLSEDATFTTAGAAAPAPTATPAPAAPRPTATPTPGRPRRLPPRRHPPPGPRRRPRPSRRRRPRPSRRRHPRPSRRQPRPGTCTRCPPRWTPRAAAMPPRPSRSSSTGCRTARRSSSGPGPTGSTTAST